MAREIDDREDLIEQLEIELDDARRKFKEQFKHQMLRSGKNPIAI